MHDKFEKEVRKKMEELRLTPSAPVWQKIELEIQPEKKRRRVFFWLLFGLLLAGGGFLTYQLTEKHPPVDEQASVINGNQTTAKNPREERQPQEPRSNEVEKAIPETNSSTTGESRQTDREDEKTSASGYLSQASKTVLQNKKPKSKPQTIQKARQENKPQQIATIDNRRTEELITKKPQEPEIKNETVKPGNSLEAVEKPKGADSLAKEPEQKTETPKAVDSVLKRKVATNKGWRKQIQITGGQSSYRTVSSRNSILMDANPQTSVGSAAPVFYRPAETKGGLAFALGFSIAKKLNEHFEVVVGLQYAYYSTQVKVGNRLQNDTLVRYANSAFSVNNYYPNASSGSYTNRFHVAEVPVTISYKPALNLPLYVSVTAAYGRVIATNALTFSNRTNVYFRNKEDYVKNMLPLSSSVQVELFSKRKMSLRVGPALQYNLLKLQKEASEGERHLFFAGIKSTVNF